MASVTIEGGGGDAGQGGWGGFSIVHVSANTVESHQCGHQWAIKNWPYLWGGHVKEGFLHENAWRFL